MFHVCLRGIHVLSLNGTVFSLNSLNQTSIFDWTYMLVLLLQIQVWLLIAQQISYVERSVLRQGRQLYLKVVLHLRRWRILVQWPYWWKADTRVVQVGDRWLKTGGQDLLIGGGLQSNDPNCNCLVRRYFSVSHISITKIIISLGYSHNWSVFPREVLDILHNVLAGTRSCP